MNNRNKVKKTNIKQQQNILFHETIGPGFISTSSLSINSKRKKLKDPNEPQKYVISILFTVLIFHNFCKNSKLSKRIKFY